MPLHQFTRNGVKTGPARIAIYLEASKPAPADLTAENRVQRTNAYTVSLSQKSLQLANTGLTGADPTRTASLRELY